MHSTVSCGSSRRVVNEFVWWGYNLAYMQYEDGTAAFYDAGKLAYFPAPFDLFDGYKLKDEAKS